MKKYRVILYMRGRRHANGKGLQIWDTHDVDAFSAEHAILIVGHEAGQDVPTRETPAIETLIPVVELR